MAKYKIAWLPGDGVGGEVLEAARLVLEKVDFDAKAIPGDIGWEFWKSEGNPLPPRTIDLLKSTDACLFGAIAIGGKMIDKPVLERARKTLELAARIEKGGAQ